LDCWDSFVNPTYELEVGIGVTKIGNSSVSYLVAVFNADENDVEATAVAQGRFVHVYVDAETRKPTAISDKMRLSLEKLLV
jgi:acyl-CoA thioester hydrolase